MNEDRRSSNAEPEHEAKAPVLRDRDRPVYVAFALYLAVAVAVIASSRAPSIIDAALVFATVVPAVALLLLIAFQLSARPRCSVPAFCIVFAGLLLSAMIALLIARAASAAI